jgi:hypothetical protein
LIWAFSVVEDGKMHRNNSFFDMHIHICVDGVLSNLHLVTIPMFERHSIKNIFNLIACFLDAFSGVTTIWHAKLVSVTTDGENTMTGCHRGIMICLKQAVEFPMLCIWCVPHQIDIVIKNAVALLQHGQWIEVAYKWCMHLRRQEKLIMDMNSEMCPKKMNRWVHLDGMFKFYISHRRHIIEHIDAHAHFELPLTKWWTIMLIAMSTINKINKTVIHL